MSTHYLVKSGGTQIYFGEDGHYAMDIAEMLRNEEPPCVKITCELLHAPLTCSRDDLTDFAKEGSLAVIDGVVWKVT